MGSLNHLSVMVWHLALPEVCIQVSQMVSIFLTTGIFIQKYSKWCILDFHINFLLIYTWIRGLPGEIPPCTLMAPDACKMIMGAMSSKFPSKLCRGNQSGGAIPSVSDQNCDGMSPDHPSGWSPDCCQIAQCVALIKR